MLFFIKLIGLNISSFFFSGAKSFNEFDDGNSIFTLILSTYEPAFLISSSSAPGIAFKWIYPLKLYSTLSFSTTVVSNSIVKLGLLIIAELKNNPSM